MWVASWFSASSSTSHYSQPIISAQSRTTTSATTMSKSESVGDDDSLAHHVEGQEEQPLPWQQRRRRTRQGRNGRKSNAHTSADIKSNLLMNYLNEYRDLVLERYQEPLSSGRKIRAMDSGMMSSMEPIIILGRQEFPWLTIIMMTSVGRTVFWYWGIGPT